VPFAGDLQAHDHALKVAPPLAVARGLAILHFYLYLNADPGALWGERLPMPSSKLNGALRRDDPAYAGPTPQFWATAMIPRRRAEAPRQRNASLLAGGRGRQAGLRPNQHLIARNRTE
jgi:hypothetical protein